MIGIMVSKKGKRENCLNLYLSYVSNLKIKLLAFTPKDINWQDKKITALIKNNDKFSEMVFPLPDVILNRLYRKNKKIVKRLEKIIGENRCFNHVNFLNKWKVYKILMNTDLKQYLPITFLYGHGNINKMLKKYRCLYLKPCYGCCGKRVYKIVITDDGEIKFYNHTVKAKEKFQNKQKFKEKIQKITYSKKFIVQQEVPMTRYNENSFDIRVLVQKNIKGFWAITNMASRITNKFFSNTSLFEKIDLTEHVLNQLDLLNKDKVITALNDISIKTAQHLEKKLGHLGELSVDFGLARDGKLTIIEVNGKPQKKIYDYLKDKDAIENIYKRPLEYAYYLCKVEEW